MAVFMVGWGANSLAWALTWALTWVVGIKTGDNHCDEIVTPYENCSACCDDVRYGLF